jgi:nicotinate-nucleotide pyrophosphorylase (carboxylating)
MRQQTGQGDIRENIFREKSDQRMTGVLVAEEAGVLSGIQRARNIMGALGLSFASRLRDGSPLTREQEIVRVTGTPVQMAQAEDRLIGALSKFSGIATASKTALQKSKGRYKVVAGGWKKMPFELKESIQQAIRDGGVNPRMSDEPFIYLDKNYVRMLGGVRKAVEAAVVFKRMIVTQIRGETMAIAKEAIEAANAGAHVVMVDTGNHEDLRAVTHALRENGLRSRVKIAFAGNIRLNDLGALAQFDLDVVDIGYAILDAPCLPMRFDVVDMT